MNDPKMDPEVVKCKIAEGEEHLEFVAKLYRKQCNRGKYFFHKHPAGGKSWHHPAMLRLRELSGVDVATADQCMYGHKTRGDASELSLRCLQ